MQTYSALGTLENFCDHASIVYSHVVQILNQHVSLIIKYSVVLYIGIMKVWGFWPEIITPRPA